MKSTRPVAVDYRSRSWYWKGLCAGACRGGFNLLINDRPDADSVEKLHATQQECMAEGVEVICFPADVGDLSLHEEMLDAAQNQWGRLDCLLDNAGISVKKRGDLLDLEPDSFDQNIAITTRAPFFLAQAFSTRLLAQPKPEAELPHRSIIFVSSINAIMLAMNRGEPWRIRLIFTEAPPLLQWGFRSTFLTTRSENRRGRRAARFPLSIFGLISPLELSRSRFHLLL